MAEFHIRPLTMDDDLDAFGRIVLDSSLALPDMPREPDYERELADVAARVRDAVVYGAFVGDTPAGCVTFVADGSSPHAEGLMPGESSFRMLGVDTATQGRGIGEALARRCVAEAAAIGSDAVFIYTGSWMHTAHRLYAGSASSSSPSATGASTPQSTCSACAERSETQRSRGRAPRRTSARLWG